LKADSLRIFTFDFTLDIEKESEKNNKAYIFTSSLFVIRRGMTYDGKMAKI
jgi:hypothetical protein